MIGRDGFIAMTLDELERQPAGTLVVERRSGGSVSLSGRRSTGGTAADLAARLRALEELIRRTDALEARARVRA